MVGTNHVEHHAHLRKRIYQNLEEHPHTNIWKNRLDKMIYFIGASGPIMSMPQAYSLWVTQSSVGVSLISWSWYLFISFIWLAYAIMHKEKPLILTNVLWIIISTIIVIEIIAFR